ncbi:DUF4173 domain-containing protein [Neolewinella aurantiaca]|uniref:DUF4173 domain-containing protein n=1 Tax=Neolewinella aurantiaca TaxID=2602767 RepID=A0A5C7FD60_9BACT|nr:DUF4173 domain-containing protein [Neolewinella aurantiaca]TXF88908.1 DUF4173 domain-containing protein [Neolewinella aurantiaca]
MKTSLKTLVASLALGLTYAFLFFHAEAGLNMFLFDAVLIGLSLWVRPDLAKHKAFVWSVGGLLFAAGSVVIVHSNAAIFAHHLTYFLVLGFAQARELRFIWFGLLLGIAAVLEAPVNAFRRWRILRRKKARKTTSRALPWLKQALVPAFVLVPFLLLYAGGNDKFAAGLELFFDAFSNLSLSVDAYWMIALTIFGSVLTLGFLLPRPGTSLLVKQQSGFRDKLMRERKEQSQVNNDVLYPTRHLRPRPHKMLALKGEYLQAVLTFGLLNLLLAAVNATDLRYVWLKTGELSAATLSSYVHTGTWNLVISIALAILVVLYYFRGNLNFLKVTPWLAPLAKLWVAQNALLALSVGVRNYHYVDAYGLAFGRVYIAFVLLLILFGLYTLFRKVRDKLSLTYLLHTNGMAAWLCLLLFAAVNWTNVITRVNLSTQTSEEIDWEHLRYLPNDNTFLLLDHPEAEILKLWKGPNPPYADWRSWNYSDWRNIQALQ